MIIAWIQKNFQHHFRTLFIILLAVVIISFVFTIGAMPGLGNASGKTSHREFFGLDLGVAEDQQRLFGDASQSIRLQAGYDALNEAQLQDYALRRQAAIALADQLKIPAPAITEIAAHIQTLGAFTDEAGKFDAKRYAEFQDTLRTNPRLNEADVARVLGDDIRVQKVKTLLGGPGYLTTEEIGEQLARTDSVWTIDVATADFATFKPAITPADADLQAYFDQNPARYQIPAKITVDYIEFPASAYVANVTLSDEAIRAAYDANPTRYNAPGQTAADDAAFAAVKDKVAAQLRQQKAAALASAAASETAIALFEQKVSVAALPDFAAKNKLALKSAPAFSRDSVPPALAGSRQVADAAFGLSAQHPYSDAVQTATGSAILAWKSLEPARQPAFAEVRDRVAADYTADQRRERFLAAGRTFRTRLETSLKTGAAFADAAKSAGEAADLNVTVSRHADFTLSKPPEKFDYSLIGSFANLGQGQTTEMTLGAGEKGVLIHVAAKKLPDLTAANPRFEEVRTQLAGLIASRGADEFLSAMVVEELARSAPAQP